MAVKRGSGRACVPASAPHEGASIVSGAGEGSNKMFAHGSTSFSGENAAARTFGRAHRHRPYHSKHVQASCEPETKRFFARRNAASTKPFGNAFAETLQASNRSGMHLQKCCKRQTVREFICRNAASVRKSGITLWYR